MSKIYRNGNPKLFTDETIIYLYINKKTDKFLKNKYNLSDKILHKIHKMKDGEIYFNNEEKKKFFIIKSKKKSLSSSFFDFRCKNEIYLDFKSYNKSIKNIKKLSEEYKIDKISIPYMFNLNLNINDWIIAVRKILEVFENSYSIELNFYSLAS